MRVVPHDPEDRGPGPVLAGLPWRAAAVALLFLVTALAGCISGDESPGGSETEEDPAGPAIPEGTIRFLVIGDQGTGDGNQRAVAKVMKDVCDARGCQFVLTTGDNVYPDGVRSEFDPQFEDKFEIPYKDLDIPFYLTLGNHDNGNGAGSNPAVGDHEVAYTFREDRMSDKWNMPARYYNFTKGPAEFFALDTGPQEVSYPAVWAPDSRGPAMEAWFEGAITRSDSDWTFAFGHHPYISNGRHGDAGTYDGVAGRGMDLQRFVEEDVCPNVDIYFAGHDHDLQWLTVAPLPGPLGEQQSCRDTHFIVSGAAGKVRSRGDRADDSRARFQAFDTFGFVWAEVANGTFTAAFYDVSGEKLYEDSFTK